MSGLSFCAECNESLDTVPDAVYWKGDESPNSHEAMIRGPDTEVRICGCCGHRNEFKP